MEKSFEYLKVQTAMDSINIENIGNVTLQANNDEELYWIISIVTEAGITEIKEFGPLLRDLRISKNGFNYNLQKAEYNEKTLCKRINNFLNDPKRGITQVTEIDDFELSDKLEDVKQMI